MLYENGYICVVYDGVRLLYWRCYRYLALFVTHTTKKNVEKIGKRGTDIFKDVTIVTLEGSRRRENEEKKWCEQAYNPINVQQVHFFLHFILFLVLSLSFSEGTFQCVSEDIMFDVPLYSFCKLVVTWSLCTKPSNVPTMFAFAPNVKCYIFFTLLNSSCFHFYVVNR